jgi:hypothetical protein
MKLRWAIVVLALTLAVASMARFAPARAVDCYTICMENCSSPGQPSYEQSACFARVQLCQQQCFAKSAPHGTYGAIAYGARSTAFGYAFNKDSADAARQTALGNCKQHGDDCKVVTSYSKTCGAVAAVEEKSVFSVGQGSSQDKAETAAMTACTRQYGTGCQVEVWTCSQ